MNEQNKKRLDDLINRLQGNTVLVGVDRYPYALEPLIQQAVSEKRQENYDNAIKDYLDIFEMPGGLNCNIMAFLFKVLVCDGELVKALRIIRLAEDALVSQVGDMAPMRFFPGGPVVGYSKWKQTTYREKLFSACCGSGYNNCGEFTVPTIGTPVALLELAREWSGNPDFNYKCDRKKLAEEIGLVVMAEIIKRRLS